MSRFEALLERFQNGEDTADEAEELARLLREDSRRGRLLYDALMLEADLYDSYAGIAQIQAARRRRWTWGTSRLLLVWSAAVFIFVALAILLVWSRTPSTPTIPAAPAAPPKTPRPPAPEVRPREREHEREREHDREHDDEGSKKAAIEREYQKGLREVERKRAEGKSEEADKKLREIERERDKQLRELERRGRDR
jgi:hypothetical protein